MVSILIFCYTKYEQSPLTLWVRSGSWRGVLDTILCDKFCQWLVTGRWFSPDTPVFCTNKTECHDITEIFLKMASKNFNLNNMYTVTILNRQ